MNQISCGLEPHFVRQLHVRANLLKRMNQVVTITAENNQVLDFCFPNISLICFVMGVIVNIPLGAKPTKRTRPSQSVQPQRLPFL